MINKLQGTLESNQIELTGSIEVVSFLAETTFGKIRGEVEDNAKLVAKFATKQDVIEDLEEIRENAKNAVEGLVKEIERATNRENEIEDNLNTEIETRIEEDKKLTESIKEVKELTEEEIVNRKKAISYAIQNINRFKRTFEISEPTELNYIFDHNLSTKDLLINVYSVEGDDLYPTIKRGYNDITLTFNEVPTRFRVVVFALNEWANVQKLAFDLPMI